MLGSSDRCPPRWGCCLLAACCKPDWTFRHSILSNKKGDCIGIVPRGWIRSPSCSSGTPFLRRGHFLESFLLDSPHLDAEVFCLVERWNPNEAEGDEEYQLESRCGPSEGSGAVGFLGISVISGSLGSEGLLVSSSRFPSRPRWRRLRRVSLNSGDGTSDAGEGFAVSLSVVAVRAWATEVSFLAGGHRHLEVGSVFGETLTGEAGHGAISSELSAGWP